MRRIIDFLKELKKKVIPECFWSSCRTLTAVRRGSIFLVLILLSTHAFADSTAGLVGWWKLDESSGASAIDSSSQANAGTLVNSPTRVGGVRAGALSLNGTNQMVRISNSAALNSINTSVVTVAAWFYVNSGGLGGNIIIFSSWGGASTGYQLYILNTGVVGAWSGSPGFTPGAAVSFNTWHHAAMVYDGTNVSIYVDGVLRGSTAKTFTTSTLENQIGAECSGAGSTGCDQYFVGSIDDVRVYNRALAPQEIYQLYIGNNKFTGATIRGFVAKP